VAQGGRERAGEPQAVDGGDKDAGGGGGQGGQGRALCYSVLGYM